MRVLKDLPQVVERVDSSVRYGQVCLCFNAAVRLPRTISPP